MDFFIISLIVVNTAAQILETVDTVYNAAPRFFRGLELASMVIFTVEYILRIWSCTAEPKYSHPVFGRLRFVVSPLPIIDFIALLPFYLPFLGLGDLRSMRALRLLAWAARLGRYFEGIRTFGNVLRSKALELVTVVVVLAIMLVLASSMMFYAEHQAQPDDFASIPEAMWWSIITLTTVGYGDVSPVTPLGKVMAGVIAVMGIGMFALPAGILGSGFLDEIQKRDRKALVCPHCGLLIEDLDK
jgi:voltage-gated potassium channel